MIEYEMTADAECRRALYRIGGKNGNAKGIRRFCFLVFLLLGLFYLYLALNKNIPGNGPLCAVMGVLFLALAFFGRRLLFLIAEGRARKAAPHTAKYTFSEENVVIAEPAVTSTYEWSAFDLHGTEDHYLWLRRANDKAYLMIDKNRITPEQAAQLEAMFGKVEK